MPLMVLMADIFITQRQLFAGDAPQDAFTIDEDIPLPQLSALLKAANVSAAGKYCRKLRNRRCTLRPLQSVVSSMDAA